MAVMSKTNVCCLAVLVLAVIILICTDDSMAVRITRRRTGTRKTPTHRVYTPVKTRRYGGPVYRSSMWKAGMAVGLVYGLTRYKTRRMYLRYPNREPRVCFNEYNLRNGTYGYFICPEWHDPDDYIYCCGASDQQYCCNYFGGGRRGSRGGRGSEGRTAGIVIGVIIVCAIIGIVVYCVCVKRRRQKAGGQVITVDQTKGNTAHAGHDQMIPLNNATGPAQYPGPSTPVPPQYGGYGTGINNPDMPYNPNPGIYPPVAGNTAYPSQYTAGGFAGDMPKYPLPPGDMSSGVAYPTDPGTGIQAPPYPPGQPMQPQPPYPPN